MLTKINAKTLIMMYDLSSSQYHSYLQPHREKLEELATKRFDVLKQRYVVRRDYNSKQLKYIVEEIFQNSPLGYEFNGMDFVKTTDHV